MSIAPGTKLGQYEVQDFLGQGAMGVVYRAYHAQLERTGAIKVMQGITNDADTVARFRHEAQAIAKLRHPNIVDVYDFGEFQGTPYMIVEYIPGGSLAGRMAHGPLDHATALSILRGIAAGLDYAHGHGVVHRDVKPANVLLTNEGTPVLADFGLAKLLQGSSLKSMTGVTTGTPAYMAPEQVTGHQVGPAADRYSLATIAYEMLTGVIPFDGEALMELLYAQVHRLPAAASSRNADLGTEVDAVLMKGLAKDPKARWETATEFVDALAAALTPAPAKVMARTMVMAPPAAPTRQWTRTTPMPPEADLFDPETVAVAYPSPPPPVAPVKRSSHRRLAIGIAAALMLVLLLGVCAVVNNQGVTMALDPNQTVPGGRVTVTATNLPAAQFGEVQLWSQVRTYSFRADSDGVVSLEIAVPEDIELGHHVVKICWNGTCHKQAPLRVVSGVAEASPTPVADTSPSGSPGTLPTPGTSPRPSGTPKSTPTSSPTAYPTSAPRSSPAPSPIPSPTPTQNPCPSNANALRLSPTTQSVVAGQPASFTGSNFTPNSNVTLGYYTPQGSSNPYKTWSVPASCSGTFSTSVVTKTGLLLRTDRVVACDVKKGCVTAYISILL